MNNKLNRLLLTIFVTLVIYSFVAFFAFDTNYQIINIILILLTINIVFNITIGLIFNKKKSRLLRNIGLININLKQISDLEKVKTFIFSKKRIISSEKYELINVENRSTISKKTIIETALQLAKLWESPYTNVLQKKLEGKPKDRKFSLKQKVKEGISVTDENDNKLLLGTYKFVQEFVKKDDGYTIYLIKNKIPIGKFTFKEELNQKGLDLSKSISRFGNVVYLDSELENNNDLLPFDKAYTCLNIDEQKIIIAELSKKAKTALFTSDKNLTGIASFDFLISESNNKQFNNNSINISFDNLNLVPKLIISQKKMHTQIEYTLFLILFLNIFFVLYLVFF